eukprot:SAG22_NODE_12810_length_428_cov_1.255319_1_plen_73_part_10
MLCRNRLPVVASFSETWSRLPNGDSHNTPWFRMSPSVEYVADAKQNCDADPCNPVVGSGVKADLNGRTPMYPS